MTRPTPMLCLFLAALVATSACASPSREAGGASAPSQQPARPKRLTAAIMSDLPVLYAKVNTTAGTAGLDAMADIVSAGLVGVDSDVNLLPVLAEAVPSIENGRWRILPDGGMETSWTLREGAQWHDGAPFTPEDLAFTITVARDRDLPSFRDEKYRHLDRIDVVDRRTARAIWRQPFAFADELFSALLGLPIPRHLLEQPYLEEKEAFIQLPYWTTDYVGAGPFKVREFVRGSYMLLDANDRFPLGRPKVDVLEIRFIEDPRSVVANLLAGEVQVTIGRSLSLDEAIPMRDQWRDGRIEVGFARWVRIGSQFVNPNPPALLNVGFRRALVHAIDRQQMVETLQYGLSTVAHTPLPPTRPEWREIDARAARYEYDPRVVGRLIEDLGFTRAADGFFRDASGGRLTVELRSTASTTLSKAQLSVANDWQQAGVAVEVVQVPPQLVRDREYRAKRPGFQMAGTTLDPNEMTSLHSSNIPRAENSYIGTNDPAYNSPAYDRLVDRYLVTIPERERNEVLAVMVRHVADELPIFTLFYDVEPTMVANGLRNVGPRRQPGTQAWNIYQWDMQ